MKIAALLAMLAGCSRKPALPPTVADLHFPVAVLFPSTTSLLYKDAADLGVMHTNLLTGPAGAPVLIDSDFKIYTMEKLSSVHGGLWLMAHPVGNTEVKFELQNAPASGLQAALDAMRAQLDKQDWRTDLEERRKSLAAQKTLPGMLKIFEVTDN